MRLAVEGILIVGLFLSTSAYSNTYYVDIHHGDNWDGDGTEASPWRNISRALDPRLNPDLRPGDVVYIAPGVYDATSDDRDYGETFPLNISRGVSLIGSSSPEVVIDLRDDVHPALYHHPARKSPYERLSPDEVVAEAESIRIANLTVRRDIMQGAGLLSYSASRTIIVENCVFENHAEALDVTGGPLVVNNTQFTRSCVSPYFPTTRPHYREMEWGTTPQLEAFLQEYERAKEEDADWLQDPIQVVRRIGGLPGEGRYTPDRVTFYYPTSREEGRFFAAAYGDGAFWTGDRLVAIIYWNVRGDDSVAEQERRIDLQRKDRVWEIAWFGERYICGRTEYVGWTTELCP